MYLHGYSSDHLVVQIFSVSSTLFLLQRRMLSGTKYYAGWAKSRYTIIIFFFTGIVNDGRELKYRTKKVDCEAILENCKRRAGTHSMGRRTINSILYTIYCIPTFGPPCISNITLNRLSSYTWHCNILRSKNRTLLFDYFLVKINFYSALAHIRLL